MEESEHLSSVGLRTTKVKSAGFHFVSRYAKTCCIAYRIYMQSLKIRLKILDANIAVFCTLRQKLKSNKPINLKLMEDSI